MQSEVDRQNACEMPLQKNEENERWVVMGLALYSGSSFGLAYKFRIWACVVESVEARPGG